MRFSDSFVFVIALAIILVLVFFTNQNQNIYAIFTIDKTDKDDDNSNLATSTDDNSTFATSTDDNSTFATSTDDNSTFATNNNKAVAKIILTKIKYKSDKFSDHILGQLTNVGNETAEKIRVLLSYYDKKNFLIDTGYVSPEIDTLEPGQKSGFNIMVGEETGDDMEAYKISFKWTHPDRSPGYAENVQTEDEEDYLVEPTPRKLTDEEIEKLGLFER
jgi:hypothetical protein